MPYTVVDKGSKHFNTILRNGGGGTFTGLGFQPDLVWQKARSTASSHYLHDAVRGVQKALFTNSTSSETTYTDQLTSFDTDGFTVNAGGDWGSGTTVVDWCWKANGAGVSNTAGSITSTVSANTTAGFSIVNYTGTGSAGATVGHGLGVAPSMIIAKQRTADDWVVYHKSLGGTKGLKINASEASETNSTLWNNTNPSSTVFTVGTNTRANGTNSIIAYCFAEVKGFSKAFSYTGNGSSDGVFTYCGFRPAFVLIKSSSSAENWHIFDNKRNTINPSDKDLRPNTSGAETTSSLSNIDFLSNGFKLRNGDADYNGSGTTYIGFAIAEQPFVSSKGIVANAR